MVLEAVNGDVIYIPQGEYEFFPEDTDRIWLNPSNNQSGFKNVCFLFKDKHDIIFDGGGSTFIFHGKCFPFALLSCKNIVLRNFKTRTYYPETAEFDTISADERGFTLRFSDSVCPYHVENGSLLFSLEGNEIGRGVRLSMHAIDRISINYLICGDAEVDYDELPSNFVRVDAEDRGNHEVYFKYRKCDHPKSKPIMYARGEKVVFNLAESRDRSGFFVEDSTEIRFEEIHMTRGAGMGIIAQTSSDIKLRAFNVYPEGGDYVSLTADILQFVNCAGQVRIENSEMGCSLDDVINIHGNYLRVESFEADKVVLRAMHESHRGFFPYRPGDEVEFSEPHTRRVLGTAVVSRLGAVTTDGFVCELYVSDVNLQDSIPQGSLLENITLAPDVFITGNYCHDYPHVRLSGRGHFLIAHNRFERCSAAVLCQDLADDWDECGRVKEMVVRDNRMVNCNQLGGNSFITFAVSGWDMKDENTPKIHEKVVVEDNVFEGVKKYKVRISGVKNAIVE